jgi:hypothetical protein
MGTTYRYPVVYSIESQANLTAEEVKARGPLWGGCERIILISIIGQAGNGEVYSQQIASLGPDGEPLPAREVFEAWTMLAHGLMKDPTLPEGPQLVCRQAFEMIRAARLDSGGRRDLALRFARALVKELEK